MKIETTNLQNLVIIMIIPRDSKEHNTRNCRSIVIVTVGKKATSRQHGINQWYIKEFLV